MPCGNRDTIDMVGVGHTEPLTPRIAGSSAVLGPISGGGPILMHHVREGVRVVGEPSSKVEQYRSEKYAKICTAPGRASVSSFAAMYPRHLIYR